MGQYDGGNYEGQTPMPMPQSQQRRGVVNAQRLSPQARNIRREAWAETPPQIYPPQTQNERLPAQPMLDSDAMSEEMGRYQQMMAQNGYIDPVSPSNPQNFATIGLPFVWCLDQATNGFVELTTGQLLNFTVAISADADFVLQAITARATREFTFLLVDSGADRRLSNQPVSAIASMGGTGRAFAPTTPQLCMAATTILVQIQDGGDQSPNIYNGNRVSDANLEPSVADPDILVNKIGLFLHGVKRRRPVGS